MPDLPDDAWADVVVSGREPPARPPRLGRLARLVLVAATVALAASVAAALHFRSEVRRPQHSRPPATGRPVPLPRMTSVTIRLPRDGTIAGTVFITAAAPPGAHRAQFVVSATISGGRPDTVYDLTGNNCSAAAPLPDHVWASGLTDAAGTAELTGHPWTGADADAYWLALSPSPVSPPPGVHGPFSQGEATRFPAGQAPCGLP